MPPTTLLADPSIRLAGVRYVARPTRGRERIGTSRRVSRYWLALAAVLAAAFVGMGYLGTWPPLATVMSASMEPTIKTGDIVVLRKLDRAPRVGDIVAVSVPPAIRSRYGYPPVIIHRIVRIDSHKVVSTKGDAFKDPDPFNVPSSALSTRVVATVPAAGRVFAFLGSTLGLVWLAGGALMLVGMPMLEHYRKGRRRGLDERDDVCTVPPVGHRGTRAAARRAAGQKRRRERGRGRAAPAGRGDHRALERDGGRVSGRCSRSATRSPRKSGARNVLRPPHARPRWRRSSRAERDAAAAREAAAAQESAPPTRVPPRRCRRCDGLVHRVPGGLKRPRRGGGGAAAGASRPASGADRARRRARAREPHPRSAAARTAGSPLLRPLRGRFGLAADRGLDDAPAPLATAADRRLQRLLGGLQVAPEVGDPVVGLGGDRIAHAHDQLAREHQPRLDHLLGRRGIGGLGPGDVPLVLEVLFEARAICISAVMNRIHASEAPKERSRATSPAAIASATDAHAGSTWGCPSASVRIWERIGSTAAAAASSNANTRSARPREALGPAVGGVPGLARGRRADRVRVDRGQRRHTGGRRPVELRKIGAGEIRHARESLS